MVKKLRSRSVETAPARDMTFQDLPEEVLQRISNCMSGKDWARICGTCKKLFELAPAYLFLKGNTQLQWAVKRWHHADELYLVFDETVADMGITLRKGGVLPDLHTMTVKTPYMRKVLEKEALSYATISVSAALSQLLSHSKQLSTLNIDLSLLPVLPQLSKLQKLSLEVSATASNMVDTCKIIQELRSLEFLQFEGRSKTQELILPELCLTGQPLTQLEFLNAIPKKLSIPEECYLRVDELGRANTQQIFHDHTEAVFHYHYNRMVPMETLPAFVSTACNLEYLHLECKSLGKPNAPCEVHNLASLTELTITGTDIFLSLGGLEQLSELFVSSQNVLEMKLQDPAEDVAERLTDYAFTYKNLQGSGLMGLLQSLALDGLKWEASSNGPTTTIKPNWE